ncbi:hypothetical protein ACVNIS_11250 [Sphaerotilaceae bacterium SBD11-9]
MFRDMPSRELALTILWIWLAIVSVLVVAWWLYRKLRRPDQTVLPQKSYARALSERLAHGRGRGHDRSARAGGGDEHLHEPLKKHGSRERKRKHAGRKQ